MFVMRAAEPLAGTQLLFSIEEFTLGRNLISALNVGKLSARAHNSPYTRECTLVRSPMNVVTVGRPSAGGQPSLSIRGSILVRALVHAESVVQPLFMAPALGHMDRFTLERTTVCVMDAAEPSAMAQTLFCIGQFTNALCFHSHLVCSLLPRFFHSMYWRFIHACPNSSFLFTTDQHPVVWMWQFIRSPLKDIWVASCGARMSKAAVSI